MPTAANELTLPVGDRVFYRLSIRGDKRDHSQKDEKKLWREIALPGQNEKEKNLSKATLQLVDQVQEVALLGE